MRELIQKQYDRVSALPDEFVQNVEWENSFEKVDVILIGDNPGRTEKKNNIFFAGKTKTIMDLVKENFAKNRKTFLSMNKSNYYTSKTNNLIEILNNPTDKNILLDIEANAVLVNEIFKKNNAVMVILFGSEKTKISKHFLRFLNIPNDNILFMKHPSYNNLAAQIGEFLLSQINSKQSIPTDLIEIFKKINKK